MRHRMGIASQTGFGNPAPEILSNEGKLTEPIKKMLDEAIQIFPLMKEYGGCDYDVDEFIRFGIEPAYQYDYLEIILIAPLKINSFVEKGRAWGLYGSEIASTRRWYSEYKYRSKFVKFIDKWHPLIFN